MVAALNLCAKSQRLVELQFAHLDLLQLRSLHQAALQQTAMQELGETIGLSDQAHQDLLRRLHEAGFNSGNLHMLHWLPIALVAWASHGVSSDEVQAARLVNLCTLLTRNTAANELFHSWLVERPEDKLVRLWEDFVQAQLAGRAESAGQKQQLLQTGEAVLYIAHKVAQASGGILGFGQISLAEQRVLDRIRTVYGLSESSVA